MIAGKVVYSILSSDPDVTNLVGSRIYPGIAPQDAAEPYIVYQVVSAVPVAGISRSNYGAQQVAVQITSWSPSYDAAMDVAEAVRKAMETSQAEEHAGVDVRHRVRLSESDDFLSALDGTEGGRHSVLSEFSMYLCQEATT